MYMNESTSVYKMARVPKAGEITKVTPLAGPLESSATPHFAPQGEHYPRETVSRGRRIAG